MELNFTDLVELDDSTNELNYLMDILNCNYPC